MATDAKDDELKENIVVDVKNTTEENDSEPEENETQETESESGQQNPGDGRSRFFSLTQVSVKINELWSTAKERVFGEDYWIPSDPFEVVDFRPDLLALHKIVYPEDTGGSLPSLVVVQGSIKNEQSMALDHVVYTVEGEAAPETNVHKFSGRKILKKRWTFAGGMKNAVVCSFGRQIKRRICGN